MYLGESLSFTVRAKQEQHPRTKTEPEDSWSFIPAHIAQVPQRIPVSAFPLRRPSSAVPTGFTPPCSASPSRSCSPGIPRHPLFLPRLRQRRSHTQRSHVQQRQPRARPRLAESASGLCCGVKPHSVVCPFSLRGLQHLQVSQRSCSGATPTKGSGGWSPAGLAEAAATGAAVKGADHPMNCEGAGKAEPRQPHVKPGLTRGAQPEAALVSPRLSCS